MGHVYVITNKIDLKAYVGQTTNLSPRMRAHKNLRGTSLLYEAVKKYGWVNFQTDIVECPDHKLDIVEKWLIKHHNTLHPNGYNKTTGGSNGKRSDYTKQQMSQATKLLMSQLTPEEKQARYQKISISNKEYYASLSESNKQAYVNKLHDITPEKRAQRVVNAMNTLSKKTPEERREINTKRSAQLRISRACETTEQRIQRGNNISKAKTGKLFSEQHRQQLSEAARRRWARNSTNTSQE
jgi:group I intron endonuclease